MLKDKHEEYTLKDFVDALHNRVDIIENEIGQIKTDIYAIQEQAHATEQDISRLDSDIDAIYSGALTKEAPEAEDEEDSEKYTDDEILKVGGTESEEEGEDEKKEKLTFSYQCVIFDDKYKFDIAMDDKRNFHPDADVWYPYCDSVVRRISKNYDTETVVLYAFYDSDRDGSGTTPNDAPYLLGSSSDCVMCGHFLYDAYQGKMTIVSGLCSYACPVKDFVEEAKKEGCTVWFRLIGNHNKVPVAKDND